MTSEQLKKGKELEDSIAYTKRELKELLVKAYVKIAK